MSLKKLLACIKKRQRLTPLPFFLFLYGEKTEIYGKKVIKGGAIDFGNLYDCSTLCALCTKQAVNITAEMRKTTKPRIVDKRIAITYNENKLVAE